jgi:hypothetical protein
MNCAYGWSKKKTSNQNQSINDSTVTAALETFVTIPMAKNMTIAV